MTVANPTLTTTKTYDGNTSAVVTAGGLQNVVNSENVTVSAIANYDTKDQGSNKVITVVYTISGTDIANYIKPVDFSVNDGRINPRPITILADVTSKYVGQPNIDLTYELAPGSEFVIGDSFSETLTRKRKVKGRMSSL